MLDYVRATDRDTGHHLTVLRSELANGNYQELKDAPALDANGDPLPGIVPASADKPYSKWLKADLQTEVAKRNEGRTEDDQISVDGSGTVADLASALDADDAASE